MISARRVRAHQERVCRPPGSAPVEFPGPYSPGMRCSISWNSVPHCGRRPSSMYDIRAPESRPAEDLSVWLDGCQTDPRWSLGLHWGTSDRSKDGPILSICLLSGAWSRTEEARLRSGWGETSAPRHHPVHDRIVTTGRRRLARQRWGHAQAEDPTGTDTLQTRDHGWISIRVPLIGHPRRRPRRVVNGDIDTNE